MKTKTIYHGRYAALVAIVLFLTPVVHGQSLETKTNITLTGDGTSLRAQPLSSSSAAVDLGLGEAVVTESTTTTAVDLEINAEADTDAASIDTTSDTSVVVVYERPAKLFGFIPVTLTEKAVVKVEGDASSVRVSKSWWSFLATSETRSNEFENQIESEIENNIDMIAEGSLSAEAKTQLVADIQAAAQATYGARAQ